MAITKKTFGFLEGGKEVFEYTLDNGNGLLASIITYGGIIKNLITKDKDGNDVDVALGRDTLEEYLNNSGCLGAAIGRNGNRIENAEFELEGKKYILAKNNGESNLHGGIIGFNKKVWEAVPFEKDGDVSLIMTMVSPDGEEGFPGTVTVTMTYTVTKDNALKIDYRATTDKTTIINLTNHSYFNLSGHNSGDIYDQILQLNSSFYTPNNAGCVPTGEITPVLGTPFDFRVPKPLGQDIKSDFEQIEMFGGYDHNFVLDGSGYRLGGVLKSQKTGIVMQMFTDTPGVQVYSANMLGSDRVCKDGAVYGNHNGVCLETQVFPNATTHKHFPTSVVKPDEVYHTVTEYKFTIEK